jgi:hypothetical protein
MHVPVAHIGFIFPSGFGILEDTLLFSVSFNRIWYKAVTLKEVKWLPSRLGGLQYYNRTSKL